MAALALALAVATVAGVTVPVGIANARVISTVEDGFDDSPETRWTVTRTSQGGTAVFANSHATISAHQATGFTAISEAILQLRGQGGATQVADAEVALVSGHGGHGGIQSTSTHATLILGRPR